VTFNFFYNLELDVPILVGSRRDHPIHGCGGDMEMCRLEIQSLSHFRSLVVMCQSYKI